MGAPLVGLLAERAFGFSGTAEVSANPEENLKKAQSLGSALLVSWCRVAEAGGMARRVGCWEQWRWRRKAGWQ